MFQKDYEPALLEKLCRSLKLTSAYKVLVIGCMKVTNLDTFSPQDVLSLQSPGNCKKHTPTHHTGRLYISWEENCLGTFSVKIVVVLEENIVGIPQGLC